MTILKKVQRLYEALGTLRSYARIYPFARLKKEWIEKEYRKFLRGLSYQGFSGYEEYDEEEKMILGIVRIGEKSLTYGGRNLKEVKADFVVL